MRKSRLAICRCFHRRYGRYRRKKCMTKFLAFIAITVCDDKINAFSLEFPTNTAVNQYALFLKSLRNYSNSVQVLYMYCKTVVTAVKQLWNVKTDQHLFCTCTHTHTQIVFLGVFLCSSSSHRHAACMSCMCVCKVSSHLSQCARHATREEETTHVSVQAEPLRFPYRRLSVRPQAAYPGVEQPPPHHPPYYHHNHPPPPPHQAYHHHHHHPPLPQHEAPPPRFRDKQRAPLQHRTFASSPVSGAFEQPAFQIHS